LAFIIHCKIVHDAPAILLLGGAINKRPQAELPFRRGLVSQIEEGSPPSLCRVMRGDIGVGFPAPRNKGDQSAIARISVRVPVVADIKV
jgi:hypothetical protein